MDAPVKILKSELNLMLKNGEVKGVYLDRYNFLKFTREEINEIYGFIQTGPLKIFVLSEKYSLSDSEMRTVLDEIIRTMGESGIYSTDSNIFYCIEVLRRELKRLLAP